MPERLKAPRRSASARTVLAVLAYFAALAGLRLWWGCEADRRYQAERLAYQAAGGVLSITDLLPEPVPEARNAARAIVQAGRAINQSDGQKVTELISQPDALQTRLAEIEQLLAANQESLRLLHESRFLHGCDWVAAGGLAAPTGPGGSAARMLAKLALLGARYQHHRGNDREALELIHDVFSLAERCSCQPNFIALLTAVAIEALATAEIEFVAPRLAVVDELDVVQPPEVPATRQQVTDLINLLLDDRGLRRAWTRAVYGDAAELIALTDFVADGKPYAGTAWQSAVAQTISLNTLDCLAFAPAVKLACGRQLRSYSLTAHAADLRCWPAASGQLQLARLPEPRSVAERWVSDPFYMVPTLNYPLELVFRHIASRRMAAAALALRLYELDHAERPQRLEELVPSYLAAVPEDPFAADGRPLGYRPDADPRVIYSVGLDGVDNGGRFALRPAGGVDPRQLDQVFFLDGNRPRPKTQPAAGTASSSPAASSQAQPDDSEPRYDEGD